MILTIAYEAATRPKAGQAHRPYTPDEDAAIRAMIADGCKYAEIAAALGRPVQGIKYRAGVVSDVRPGQGPGPRPVVGTDHCRRCTALLIKAPPGDGRLCGWCTPEVSR